MTRAIVRRLSPGRSKRRASFLRASSAGLSRREPANGRSERGREARRGRPRGPRCGRAAAAREVAVLSAMRREEPSMDPKHIERDGSAPEVQREVHLSQEPAPTATAADRGRPRAGRRRRHAPVTREQRRSRRKRDDPRAHDQRQAHDEARARARAACSTPRSTTIEAPRRAPSASNGERPCPFVSCKHHLYLDVSARTGAIKLNFPDLEVWEMTETCALDVADRGGTTLEEVGAIMNLTRERIRQVEVKGLAKLEALARHDGPARLRRRGPGRQAPPARPRKTTDDEDEDDEDEDAEDEDEVDATDVDAATPSSTSRLRASTSTPSAGCGRAIDRAGRPRYPRAACRSAPRSSPSPTRPASSRSPARSPTRGVDASSRAAAPPRRSRPRASRSRPSRATRARPRSWTAA